MTKLYVYWLEMDDDRNAVVVSPDAKGALAYAQIVDPTGDWNEAEPDCFAECTTTMSPGVISLERRIPDED